VRRDRRAFVVVTVVIVGSSVGAFDPLGSTVLSSLLAPVAGVCSPCDTPAVLAATPLGRTGDPFPIFRPMWRHRPAR